MRGLRICVALSRSEERIFDGDEARDDVEILRVRCADHRVEVEGRDDGVELVRHGGVGCEVHVSAFHFQHQRIAACRLHRIHRRCEKVIAPRAVGRQVHAHLHRGRNRRRFVHLDRGNRGSMKELQETLSVILLQHLAVLFGRQSGSRGRHAGCGCRHCGARGSHGHGSSRSVCPEWHERLCPRIQAEQRLRDGGCMLGCCSSMQRSRCDRGPCRRCGKTRSRRDEERESAESERQMVRSGDSRREERFQHQVRCRALYLNCRIADHGIFLGVNFQVV